MRAAFRKARCVGHSLAASTFFLAATVTELFAQSGVAQLPIAAASGSVAVEVAKALAWPLVAFVAALVFREPLTRFVEALGARTTKLSVFKVELELAAGAAPAKLPLLEDIQHAPSSAEISDSSRMMLEQAQSTEPADFAVINLGDGDEWLTSRLYIAAAMLERMRGVKVFVFVERAAGSNRRFVALESVSTVRWVLARRFPWLEVAFARAYAASQGIDPRHLPASTRFVTSDTGALESYPARQLVAAFIDSLQLPTGSSALGSPGAPSPVEEWFTLSGGRDERAALVTRRLLEELLPPGAFALWADEGVDLPRSRRTQAVLRRRGSFVALLDCDRRFSRLVHRSALLENVVESLVDEASSAAK